MLSLSKRLCAGGGWKGAVGCWEPPTVCELYSMGLPVPLMGTHREKGIVSLQTGWKGRRSHLGVACNEDGPVVSRCGHRRVCWQSSSRHNVMGSCSIGYLRLDIMKNCCSERVVMQWNRLSRQWWGYNSRTVEMRHCGTYLLAWWGGLGI